jgi:drug/metabolite transporter (DMT)-like permease
MNKWKVHSALLLVNLIYGANYSIAKAVMPHFIKPYGFIFVRVFFASILFLLLNQVISNKEKIAKADLPRLILCALLGVAANQLMFFQGLNLTSPINASVIMTTIPLIVLIASAFLLKERLSWMKISGACMGLTGASLLILSKPDISLENSHFAGDLLIFGNATSFAFYLVLVKPLMRKYKSKTVIQWIFLIGLLIVSPFGWEQFQEVQWHSLPSGAWLAIIFVVFFTTFLAYLLNIWALQYVNSSVVGIFIYLQPVFASIIALSAGQDSLSFQKIAYSLLIFSGVYLVTKSAKPKQPAK